MPLLPTWLCDVHLRMQGWTGERKWVLLHQNGVPPIAEDDNCNRLCALKYAQQFLSVTGIVTVSQPSFHTKLIGQQIFSVSMLLECFQRGGWEVKCPTSAWTVYLLHLSSQKCHRERSMHDVFVACVTDDPAKYVYDTESSHFTMHWIHMKWSCGHVRYESHIQLYLLGFCSRPWCWNSRWGTLQPLQ